MITLFIVSKYAIAQHKQGLHPLPECGRGPSYFEKTHNRPLPFSWVKVFRITPEFSILRLTFHDFEANFPQHFEADFPQHFEADFPQKVSLKVLN